MDNKNEEAKQSITQINDDFDYQVNKKIIDRDELIREEGKSKLAREALLREVMLSNYMYITVYIHRYIYIYICVYIISSFISYHVSNEQ